MFGCAVKNRMALEEILKNILKMDLHVSEFVVSSYDIPQECWCQLGNEENAVLGKNIQLGRTYMSATREFKISLGPVDFKECQALLPGSKGFELLTEIINLYMDRPLEYTLLFKICSKSIPQASFGDKKSVQLGRCCWVGKANKNADVIQLSIGAARLNRKHHRGTFFNVE